MWALLTAFLIQTVPTGTGWSVYSPTPLTSHDRTASVCVGRHRGSHALQVEMRCRIGADGRLTDCQPAGGRELSHRDLATLQCVARSQSLPGRAEQETMPVTITIVSRKDRRHGGIPGRRPRGRRRLPG